VGGGGCANMQAGMCEDKKDTFMSAGGMKAARPEVQYSVCIMNWVLCIQCFACFVSELYE
jgi:hypothetical protein